MLQRLQSLSSLVLAVFGISTLSPLGAEEVSRTGSAESGERIYARLCASCHGERGQGVRRKYSRALRGDKSIAQLTRYIEESMPEDEEDECVGSDAAKVAKYVHDTFYSPIAQARLAPPRIELARLTVDQYRSALADLVGSFRDSARSPTRLGEERGLRGQYYNDRQPGRRAALERTDTRVDFDFGARNPSPGKIDEHGFAARWEGSVVAPETGLFEFVVHTDHAVRLWVNDRDDAVIDAWVKSGSGTEFRASRFLIGGRAYPLRLEFTSRDQGVNKKKEPKKVNAFLRLAWVRPNRREETIPTSYLVPERVVESFVVDTPFPPDDRSAGYERGASISKAWDDATTGGAIQTASYVVAHLRELSGTKPDDQDRAGKLREFCANWLERAFRRALSNEEREIYLEKRFRGAADLDLAVRRVVLLSLKSPRFLYVDPERATTAERLAFSLWDSIPDASLLRASREGRLSKREDIARRAETMLEDERSRAKVRAFFEHYLDVEAERDLSKEAQRFPKFSPEIAADLRRSLDLLVESVLRSPGADLRDLFRSRRLFLNRRLADYFGYQLGEGDRRETPDDFVSVESRSAARVGIVSHPYLLARFSYRDVSSPIHRGVFVARHLLGRALRPPPEAAVPLAAELHPGLTTRQRVELQTEPDACRGCHSLVNPLGFALESFDADGRFREREGDRPIDDRGTYELPSGEVVEFRGADGLAGFLAEYEGMHRAFVSQLFEHMVKQPIAAYGVERDERLRREFAADTFSIRKLLVRIAVEAGAAPRQDRNGEDKP